MSHDEYPSKYEGYRRPRRGAWWMEKRSYTLFLLRELTAVFVGLYASFWLYAIYRAGADQMSFVLTIGAFLTSPVGILFNVIVLVAVLYHTITWFSLLPKVMVLWRGEEKLPPAMLIGVNWAGWFIVTAAVTLLAAMYLHRG
jgi:fumarate reductase subunit C